MDLVTRYVLPHATCTLHFILLTLCLSCLAACYLLVLGSSNPYPWPCIPRHSISKVCDVLVWPRTTPLALRVAFIGRGRERSNGVRLRLGGDRARERVGVQLRGLAAHFRVDCIGRGPEPVEG